MTYPYLDVCQSASSSWLIFSLLFADVLRAFSGLSKVILMFSGFQFSGISLYRSLPVSSDYSVAPVNVDICSISLTVSWLVFI